MLLGGAIVGYLTSKFTINKAMLWGATIQVVTGIALSAPLGRAVQPPAAKLAVKLVFAIMIFVMVFFSRKREAVNKGHFLAILGLTLVNAGVATFWH